jgi:hypothetical protein
MKSGLYILFCICLLRCSPYKEVTVTKSDQLTKRWKGETEQAVITSIGSYKSKSALANGFLIRYDYSYLNVPALAKSRDFQIQASNQHTNPMIPSGPQPEHRSAEDSVIRRMDFYFDTAHRVQYVAAIGFPDSVYMVKRK